MRASGFDAGQRLAARLDQPVDDAPRAGAVLAHCFTCSKDLRALRLIADALARAGFAVLRLDFAGLGASVDIGGRPFTIGRGCAPSSA